MTDEGSEERHSVKSPKRVAFADGVPPASRRARAVADAPPVAEARRVHGGARVAAHGTIGRRAAAAPAGRASALLPSASSSRDVPKRPLTQHKAVLGLGVRSIERLVVLGLLGEPVAAVRRESEKIPDPQAEATTRNKKVDEAPDLWYGAGGAVAGADRGLLCDPVWKSSGAPGAESSASTSTPSTRRLARWRGDAAAPSEPGVASMAWRSTRRCFPKRSVS